MIIYVYGDIFQSPARVLVNPVNTVGVMGKGLAADFKRFFPAMFTTYHTLCMAGKLAPGKLHLYQTAHKWVLNFPTKKHWRDSATLDLIEAGLQKFVSVYAEHNITSISFPELGTGEGGLAWQDVRPLMESYLDPLPIVTYIHHDDGAALSRGSRTLSAWLNTQPQNITLDKVWRDLVRLIKRKTDFVTAEGTTFTVTQDMKSRNRNLVLGCSGQNTFLSDSLLSDLWAYIRGAGYVLPDNLPGGLDTVADCLLAFFSELDYVKTVKLATGKADTTQQHSGLHYFPPAQKEDIRPVMLTTTPSTRSDV